MVFQQHMIQVRFLENKSFSSCEQTNFSLVIFGFVPKMNSFFIQMKQQQIMQQQLLEEVGEQNCQMFLKKPDLFTILLFVQWQNTEYKKRPLTYYGKSFSRFFSSYFQ